MFHNGTVEYWPRTTMKSAEINGKCIRIVGLVPLVKGCNYSLKNGLNVLYDPH